MILAQSFLLEKPLDKVFQKIQNRTKEKIIQINKKKVDLYFTLCLDPLIALFYCINHF